MQSLDEAAAGGEKVLAFYFISFRFILISIKFLVSRT